MRISGPHTHENLVAFFLRTFPTCSRSPHPRGGVGQGQRPSQGNRRGERTFDREYWRPGGLDPVGRYREGRQAGPGAQSQYRPVSQIDRDAGLALRVKAAAGRCAATRMPGALRILARALRPRRQIRHQALVLPRLCRVPARAVLRVGPGRRLPGFHAAQPRPPDARRGLANEPQLSLESDDLDKAQEAYAQNSPHWRERDRHSRHEIWAVNGSISGAEAYPSDGLFRKMFAKNLRASTTEAIGEKASQASPAPTSKRVEAFLAAAKQGQLTEMDLPGAARIATRVSGNVIFSEGRAPDGARVHRAYVAEHA